MATKKEAVVVKDKEIPFKEVTESEKSITIVIHKQSGDTGSTDVQVGVNGKTWLIKRGLEVVVPVYVEEALRHAVQYEMGYDPENHSTPINEVLTYPYSVVG
jgi:hypothetical protein